MCVCARVHVCVCLTGHGEMESVCVCVCTRVHVCVCLTGHGDMAPSLPLAVPPRATRGTLALVVDVLVLVDFALHM